MGCQWQLPVQVLLELYYPPGTLIWIICKHSRHWNAILQSDIFGLKDRYPGRLTIRPHYILWKCFSGNSLKSFLESLCRYWSELTLSTTLDLGVPDRSEVYFRCNGVYTADPLQHMECICSIGCVCTADTLHSCLVIACMHTAPALQVYGSVIVAHTAKSIQPTLSLHRKCSTLPVHCQVGGGYIRSTVLVEARGTEGLLNLKCTP